MAKLRVAHLRLLVPFLLIGWNSAQAIDDNSLLWHIRAGTIQLDLGRVLTVDPFSLTEHGSGWRTQSWLAELGYGWLENVTGGIGWVPVMKLVVMTLTVALLGVVVYRVVGGHHGYTVLGMLLLVWQGAPFEIGRPAIIGFLFLAVAVAVTQMKTTPLWVFPPLFWVWAAVHGSFPVGLGLILLDALRRKSRRQMIAVVIAGAATGLTAHGLGTWWIVLQFFRNRDALALISEWHPPDFTNPFIIPLLIVIVGLLVAATLGKIKPTDLWVVIPFVVFGVIAERNIWPAFIVLLPYALRVFPHRQVAAVDKRRSEPYLLNWGIAVVLLVVATAPLVRSISLSEERFPSSAAVAALEPGPLFNGSAVGGYLIYADWPAHQVYIDDRAELYGFDGFQQFHDLKSGLGVQAAFAELGINQVLVTADWPIVGYLELLGWDYRYRDEYFVVMGS